MIGTLTKHMLKIESEDAVIKVIKAVFETVAKYTIEAYWEDTVSTAIKVNCKNRIKIMMKV